MGLMTVISKEPFKKLWVYVYVSVCGYVHVVWVHYLRRPGGGTGSSAAGITGGCESPNWEPNSDVLQKQCVASTTEASLQL